MFCCDSKNKLDNDNIDIDLYIEKLELDNSFDDCGNPELKEWFAGIKYDPLRCAHRIFQLLCSLDQCREGFHSFIQDGNRQNWFFKKIDGNRTQVKLSEVQPLRDVKTRWDLVYLMLEYLRQLQPVSSS